MIYEDRIWYKVETLAGDGWLPADSLDPVD
jgi:hypothetical protein